MNIQKKRQFYNVERPNLLIHIVLPNRVYRIFKNFKFKSTNHRVLTVFFTAIMRRFYLFIL